MDKGVYIFCGVVTVIIVMVGCLLAYGQHQESKERLNSLMDSTKERFEEEIQKREEISLAVNEKLNTTDAYVIDKDKGKYEVLAGGDLYTVVHNSTTGEINIFLNSKSKEQP